MTLGIASRHSVKTAENPGDSLEERLIWTIESVAEMDADEYTDEIFDEAIVKAQIQAPDFDDRH